MPKVSCRTVLAILLCLHSMNSVAFAAISVDGAIGAEWSGATVKSVLFNPSAPTNNFGSPTNENSEVAYDIFTRGDADFLYVGLETTTNYAGGLNFANLYFGTNPPGGGSVIGFEVTNDRAFLPGVPGYTNYTPGIGINDISWALTAGSSSSPSVLEFAVPWSVFTSDSLGVGFSPLATTAVQLRLSQSFGYSVAGGGASYGNDRLGIVPLAATNVPEPASFIVWSLLTLALGGAGWLRRSKRAA